MLRRRTFLKSLFWGLGSFTLAAGGSYWLVPSYAKTLINLIQNDLAFLKIDKKDIEKFVNEAVQTNYFLHTRPKKEMIRYYSVLTGLPLPYQYKYRQYRAEVVSKFLLSTDFFLNRMDETRKINYLKLYSPYTFPCSNPFSSVYYPREA
jgi:hypothetical protein